MLDADAAPSGPWVARHPVLTLAAAVLASLMAGIGWLLLFFWWHEDRLELPLLLAAASWGLFRWLRHRIQ